MKLPSFCNQWVQQTLSKDSETDTINRLALVDEQKDKHGIVDYKFTGSTLRAVLLPCTPLGPLGGSRCCILLIEHGSSRNIQPLS
jgi:hypothetical protein